MSAVDASFLLGVTVGALGMLGVCVVAALMLLRVAPADVPDDEPASLVDHRLPYDVGAPLPVSGRGAGSLYPRPPLGSPARERVSHGGRSLLRVVGSEPSPATAPALERPNDDGEGVCNSSPVRGDSIHGFRATGPDSRRGSSWSGACPR